MENEKSEISEEALSEFRSQWRKELVGNQEQKEEMNSENLAALLFQQGVELERKLKCFKNKLIINYSYLLKVKEKFLMP